jgi:hypothetical protein
MIAQVDKQDAAMISLAMHPPGQANGLPDIALAKLRAVVGTVGVHRDSFV